MEIKKSCFVEVGEGLRLPIGFRFRPTDEELVVHYLKRKSLSFPLPASVIQEHQVFGTNPWDLPGELKERRYFFNKNKENVKNNRRIEAGSGFWKAIGHDKPIFVSISQNHHQLVGMKKTSIFCQRKKRVQRMKTWWVMKQFFLVDSIGNTPSSQNFIVQTGDWVVCCIFQQKKRGARKNGVKKQESNKQSIIESDMMIIEEDNNKNNYYPTQEASSPSPSPSPSCSSVLTEIESLDELVVGEMDEEATSWGCYTNSI